MEFAKQSVQSILRLLKFREGSLSILDQFSIFCCSQEEVRMKLVLAEPLSQLQATARHIADISNECKLPVSQDEYVESFKPVLMDVVHAWSKVRSLGV